MQMGDWTCSPFNHSDFSFFFSENSFKHRFKPELATHPHGSAKRVGELTCSTKHLSFSAPLPLPADADFECQRPLQRPWA